jgi:uncharacterized membrane protein YdjX (TVP38/TMEM64 family)
LAEKKARNPQERVHVNREVTAANHSASRGRDGSAQTASGMVGSPDGQGWAVAIKARDVNVTGGGPRGAASLRRYWPLAALVLATALIVATGAHRYLSLDTLISHRHRLQAGVAEHGALALAAYALVYVGVVALSIPGAAVLTILGGFLFGWFIGGAVAVLAATAGSLIVFLIARTSLGEGLVRKAGPRLKKLADGFRQDAFAYLLFLRLVPLFPFWLVNLAPALVGTPLKTFALATFVGILPGTFAFAFAGAGLDSVVAAQHAAQADCVAAGRADCVATLHVSALVTPQLLAALAALGLMALVPVVAKRVWAKRARPLDAENGGV